MSRYGITLIHWNPGGKLRILRMSKSCSHLIRTFFELNIQMATELIGEQLTSYRSFDSNDSDLHNNDKMILIRFKFILQWSSSRLEFQIQIASLDNINLISIASFFCHSIDRQKERVVFSQNLHSLVTHQALMSPMSTKRCWKLAVIVTQIDISLTQNLHSQTAAWINNIMDTCLKASLRAHTLLPKSNVTFCSILICFFCHCRAESFSFVNH